MRLRVDLHIHSDYSCPGYGTIDEVLARAEERGLDGIAITDLGTITGALEARKKASKLLVIPGCEVQTEFGHLLALGLKEPLPVRLQYEETIKRTRSRGGIVVLAHPYAGLPKRAIWEKCKPDAVETVNALYPFFDLQTYMSRAMARGFGLPEIGGSDAHFYSNIGDAYTVLDAEDFSVDAIIEAIHKGLTSAQGKPQPIRTRFLLSIGVILSYIF